LKIISQVITLSKCQKGSKKTTSQLRVQQVGGGKNAAIPFSSKTKGSLKTKKDTITTFIDGEIYFLYINI